MAIDQQVTQKMAKVLTGANVGRTFPTNPGGVTGAVMREGIVTGAASNGVVQVKIGGDTNSVPVRFLNAPPPVNAYVVILVLGTTTYIIGEYWTNAPGSGKVVQERQHKEGAAGSNSTASTTFTSIYSSLSFTKIFTGTNLRFDLMAIGYMTVAGTFVFGVTYNAGGTYTELAHCGFAAMNDYKTLAGVTDISGVAAGAYTLQPAWRVTAGTANVDTNAYISYTVKEVWP